MEDHPQLRQQLAAQGLAADLDGDKEAEQPWDLASHLRRVTNSVRSGQNVCRRRPVGLGGPLGRCGPEDCAMFWRRSRVGPYPSGQACQGFSWPVSSEAAHDQREFASAVGRPVGFRRRRSSVVCNCSSRAARSASSACCFCACSSSRILSRRVPRIVVASCSDESIRCVGTRGDAGSDVRTRV